MTTLNLSVTITPDAKAAAMLAAFCEAHGYDPDAGQTQIQFLKSEIIEFVRQPYVAKQTAASAQASRIALAAEIAGITIG